MVSAHTIIATVDIKPWTAYVTIPDVPDIIVDPPKTGDAASIMGVVMVALSGRAQLLQKARITPDQGTKHIAAQTACRLGGSSFWAIVNPFACSLLRNRLLKNEKSSSNRLLPRHGSATMH
jgi:hypothetical protein